MLPMSLSAEELQTWGLKCLVAASENPVSFLEEIKRMEQMATQMLSSHVDDGVKVNVNQEKSPMSVTSVSEPQTPGKSTIQKNQSKTELQTSKLSHPSSSFEDAQKHKSPETKKEGKKKKKKKTLSLEKEEKKLVLEESLTLPATSTPNPPLASLQAFIQQETKAIPTKALPPRKRKTNKKEKIAVVVAPEKEGLPSISNTNLVSTDSLTSVQKLPLVSPLGSVPVSASAKLTNCKVEPDVSKTLLQLLLETVENKPLPSKEVSLSGTLKQKEKKQTLAGENSLLQYYQDVKAKKIPDHFQTYGPKPRMASEIKREQALAIQKVALVEEEDDKSEENEEEDEEESQEEEDSEESESENEESEKSEESDEEKNSKTKKRNKDKRKEKRNKGDKTKREKGDKTKREKRKKKEKEKEKEKTIEPSSTSVLPKAHPIEEKQPKPMKREFRHPNIDPVYGFNLNGFLDEQDSFHKVKRQHRLNKKSSSAGTSDLPHSSSSSSSSSSSRSSRKSHSSDHLKSHSRLSAHGSVQQNKNSSSSSSIPSHRSSRKSQSSDLSHSRSR